MWRQWMLRFILLLVFLAGCAPLAPRVVVDQGIDLKGNQALLQTFKRYWAYRAKGDMDEAFKLEAPYVQEMLSRGRYRNFLNLFSKAQLKEVHIYGIASQEPFYICLNSREIYERKGKKETRDFRDCWVEVNRKWYHVLENPLMFPQLGSTGSVFLNVNPLTFSSPLT